MIAARLQDVHIRFGESEILRNVALEVHRGEIMAIVGPNGAGKTTLIRLLAGLLRPDRGEVEILGTPSPAIRGDREELRHRLAYVSQKPTLDPEMTGRETLDLLATLYGFGGPGIGGTAPGAARREPRIHEAIQAFGLESFVGRLISRYSGGEKRRLHVAAALLHAPELILLDEPMAGLDKKSRRRLWQDLAAHARGGAAVVIVSHDHSALAEHADRIVEVEHGAIRPSTAAQSPRAQEGPSGSPPARRREEETEASRGSSLQLRSKWPAGAWQMCRRSWLKTVRRPVTLTFSLAQPLIWMGFFGFLFERYQVVEFAELRYLDFLVPGVCAMTVLFGASQSGVSWIRDLQTGFLPRLLQTPASPHALLLGKIGADVLRLLLQASAVLILALVLGARISTSPLALLAGLPALVLFAAAFSSLSCAIALKARAQEAMATFVHLVNMPMLFTSTALVPAKQMPSWLEGVAAFNPLTLAVDAWRGALLDGRLPEAGQIVPLAALTLVLYFLAARQMREIRGLS